MVRESDLTRKAALTRKIAERCLGQAYTETSGRFCNLTHSLSKLSNDTLTELLLGLNEHRCQKCFNAPKPAYCDSCFTKSICKSCGVRQKRDDLGVCQTCAES